jgi:hypothetical protein
VYIPPGRGPHGHGATVRSSFVARVMTDPPPGPSPRAPRRRPPATRWRWRRTSAGGRRGERWEEVFGLGRRGGLGSSSRALASGRARVSSRGVSDCTRVPGRLGVRVAAAQQLGWWAECSLRFVDRASNEILGRKIEQKKTKLIQTLTGC